ncbi:predicted protein [Histoplasma mississippiense (nom. inval.)]|uniref:predicted protein n=1 Tax=Ajellomyces capsulatus (strain NAm1 / WU24) TaxID=2059318 RepID=UPI000157C54C|nr:predicted protein [Histoplasma mississippiense (nom. inval.)]EDN08745.1 predicted protein [Histoplasma mississippiense (nom. inval.)]
MPKGFSGKYQAKRVRLCLELYRLLSHGTMDVEHLIALLTEVAPQNELPRRADTRLEDTFHERLRIVLDAIASTINKLFNLLMRNIGSVNILKKCSMIINWMLHHLPDNSRLFPVEKEDYVVEGLNSIAGMVEELFETKTWLADLSKTSSKIDALPYIGVSKLSCVACWEFFNALHKVDCMFYVRGSHSKAYFPWKFPDVEMNTAKFLESEKEKILNSFYSDLAATYTQRFKARERLRRMSERSTGSTKPIPRDRWPAEKFPWGS